MPAKKELKVPPQDLEAESSVLGALLLDRNAIMRVADVLEERDFYHPNHQHIYNAILDLFSRGEPIDVLTVSRKLKEKKLLNTIGPDYLTDLVGSVPTAAHVDHYASLVKEKKVRRDLISISSDIGQKAFEEGDVEMLLDSIEQSVFGVSQHSRPQKFTPVKHRLQEAYERIEKLHQGEGEGFRGIPTLFPKIDSLLSGLQASDLIIVGARPSFGKTTFVLDIARQIASQGRSVGIFSLEMSEDQVIDRLIAAQAQVPLWRLRTGKLNIESDFNVIQKALDDLSQMKIFIDDTPAINIIQMRSMARRLQAEHGLDLLVVDYLQLIQPRTKSDNIVQQVTEISRGLKFLARELGIPVIAVSQLSRAVDQREGRVPRLSDLRESGSLEQDSDVVMFICRKDRGKPVDEISDAEKNIVEIAIAKHRNGPLGTVTLWFDEEKVSFKSIDTKHGEDNL